MSYSQDNEEVVILEHFGARVGKFLDIGAADGIHFSNTRALVERGWGGVMVEPSPRQFMQLWELYKNHTGIVLVNAALSAFAKLVPFHYSPDTVVNTINKDVHEEWARDFTYWQWKIFTLPVERFLEEFPYTFDFVSIDAEGESWTIAKELLAYKMRSELLCVEHDKNQLTAIDGYKLIHSNGNNTIWKLGA